jgi:hypothetical protein
VKCNYQGTLADGAITKLFVGKMKSYIKCVNVDFESSRMEDFNGDSSHIFTCLVLIFEHQTSN